MNNAKAHAWDNIGNLFWERGRKSAKPSAYEMELFTRGVQPGDCVCIVGASTKDLVCLLQDMGAKVTVYDFSKGMCDSLRAAVPDPAVTIEQLDIVAPMGEEMIGSQDFVMNDRLINRFTESEAEAALQNMCALARLGNVRASIKLGFYPMDYEMMKLGSERGTLAEFFDEKCRTIDFSKAGMVLNDALHAHGDIDLNLLLTWYRGRAAEKRFEHEDILALAQKVALPDGAGLDIVEVHDFPDAISTTLYDFRVR